MADQTDQERYAALAADLQVKFDAEIKAHEATKADLAAVQKRYDALISDRAGDQQKYDALAKSLDKQKAEMGAMAAQVASANQAAGEALAKYNALKKEHDALLATLPQGKTVKVYVPKPGDRMCPKVAPMKGQQCPICGWIYQGGRPQDLEPHPVG